jgi:hypothetical protein
MCIYDGKDAPITDGCEVRTRGALPGPWQVSARLRDLVNDTCVELDAKSRWQREQPYSWHELAGLGVPVARLRELMLGRSAVFVGDSVSMRQAWNLVALSCLRRHGDRLEYSMRHVKEPSESPEQRSRCWAVRDHRGSIRCRVCWISAGKGPERRIGDVVATLLQQPISTAPLLTQRDIVVTNAGLHYRPTDKARLRDELASLVAAVKGAQRLVRSSTLPLLYYRTTSPQFWRNGIYHYTSNKVDCLPAWDVAAMLRRVANGTDMRDVLGSKGSNAYNQCVCCALHSAPVVQMLDIWLLTAVMGPAESWRPYDCSHFFTLGSVPSAWNQLLLAGAGIAAAPAPENNASAETKWARLRALLNSPLPRRIDHAALLAATPPCDESLPATSTAVQFKHSAKANESKRFI